MAMGFSNNPKTIPLGMCLGVSPVVEILKNYESNSAESPRRMINSDVLEEKVADCGSAEHPMNGRDIACIFSQLPQNHKIEFLEILKIFSEVFKLIDKSLYK
ncbi:hypothetical protein LAZ67_10001293 [Cordylochernes scorpioides]|uniref:Uncharacterized protein n=1 Tax=Cordylochernes scorpioides TaxID=51811 RepID=A0ABY6KVT5_9ARAC|nr:hypothetical protein LAZ67_10001293 [Cordylochernes scorpioides]